MATKKTTTTTTTHKRSSGTVTKYGILKGCSYFALVIAATMFLIGGIFTGSVASIINLIAKLFVLIGIGIPAYDYTRGKKNGVASNLLDRACRICARLRIRRDGRLNQVSKNVEIFRKRRQSLRLSVFFLYKIGKTGYNKRVQR